MAPKNTKSTKFTHNPNSRIISHNEIYYKKPVYRHFSLLMIWVTYSQATRTCFNVDQVSYSKMADNIATAAY